MTYIAVVVHIYFHCVCLYTYMLIFLLCLYDFICLVSHYMFYKLLIDLPGECLSQIDGDKTDPGGTTHQSRTYAHVLLTNENDKGSNTFPVISLFNQVNLRTDSIYTYYTFRANYCHHLRVSLGGETCLCQYYLPFVSAYILNMDLYVSFIGLSVTIHHSQYTLPSLHSQYTFLGPLPPPQEQQ